MTQIERQRMQLTHLSSPNIHVSQLFIFWEFLSYLSHSSPLAIFFSCIQFGCFWEHFEKLFVEVLTLSSSLFIGFPRQVKLLLTIQFQSIVEKNLLNQNSVFWNLLADTCELLKLTKSVKNLSFRWKINLLSFVLKTINPLLIMTHLKTLNSI